MLSSIIILGMVFLWFASRYFTSDRFKTMYLNAVTAAQNASEYSDSPESLEKAVDVMAQSTQSIIFITDKQGKTLYCSEPGACVHKQTNVPKSILWDIDKKGMYNEIGKFENMYSQNMYTLAVPISNVSENDQVAYIFVASQITKQQRAFLNEMLKIFAISAGVVLVITFAAIYFMTLRLVRPMRQMADAAQKFGKGEFNTRIEVTSEDELGQLAIALNNMAQSLSVSETTRRNFIANVSHELKTPMTSIAGFVDGILDKTIPPEKQNYYLQIVSDEVKRLSRLVKSMLNLSKIEAGEMQINRQNFNIVELLCRAVFNFEPQINEKNIEIEGLDHDKVIVSADPDLIYQVVYNLTENAVKFTNNGGYMRFDVEEGKDAVTVKIRNSGDGLSKEEMNRIFERFYKTDRSRGLDKNGVGLGLYIVRSIVQLHGGDVKVDSKEKEYVEFSFTIPCEKEQSKPQNKFKKS